MGLFTKTSTIRFDIEGMTCGNCVKHVTEAIGSVGGVKSTTVDLDEGRAEVQAKPDTDVGAIVAAVADAGYTATPRA